jgi:glycopeptide antibiotics resistance protein
MVEEHGRVQVRQMLLAGLLLLLLLAAAMMLVPNYTLAWVRSEIAWLSHLISRVEMLWPVVNTGHLLAFAMLGLLTRLALPRSRLSLIVLVYLVFSVVAELLQFYIPGRTPKVTDVRDNMAGLALGLVAASVLCWIWRRASRRVAAG